MEKDAEGGGGCVECAVHGWITTGGGMKDEERRERTMEDGEVRMKPTAEGLVGHPASRRWNSSTYLEEASRVGSPSAPLWFAR